MKEKICGLGLFRWVSGLKLWKWFSSHPFFGKFCNYEMITYIICGVLTTVVNYVVYFLMPRFGSTGLDLVIANVTAWVCAAVFAFFVNKIFVFDSAAWDPRTLFREFFSFLAARLLSLGFETLVLYLTVELLNWNEPLMKVLASIFVLVMNYIASKFIIFKKKKDAGTEDAASGSAGESGIGSEDRP